MKSLAIVAALGAVLLSSGTNSTEPVSASGTYEVDGGHSSVVFSTKHLDVSRFYGRFNEVSGSIDFNEADVTQSRVSIEIPTASVDSNSEQRDGHLKSPDFFSAKEFPVITYESKSITDSADAFEIQGELTLRGVTKPVTAKAVQVGSGDTMFGDFRSGFEARFEIQPADFGFTFMKEKPKAVGPGVEVIVSLECIKQ